jgi:coenzyme PQQ precursor peptide PqqA
MDMNWEAPDFEEVMTSAEMTAYAGHWTDEEDGLADALDDGLADGMDAVGEEDDA